MEAQHVLIRRGDGLQEVESILASLAAEGVDRVSAGIGKIFYVTRADQTVVTTRGGDDPLAARLRAAGWDEPASPP